MLRGDLDWIVMKALDKDRKRRYDSPIEFARDIDCYLAHEPVVARPPTLPYRLSKYARRHWVTLSVASSLVFLLTIGLAFMWSLFMEKQAALAENQAALSQKQAILAKYRGEIESNVLDVLLTGATDVSELMDDAREAESSSATLAWFQALDHLNRDQRDEAVEKLKKLQETESELTVAAHATLVSAYYEAGKLTEYYIELESLLKREPVSYADRLMLGEALQWSDYKRTELYLREAVKERDNPLARTRCARSIAVAAMLQQNSQLASEATDFIQVAEIMAPDLPIVNDTSVFVHHIGMLYSDGCEQERHEQLAHEAAAFPERDAFGEMIRANFFEYLGEIENAKKSFIAAAESGDMPAYYLAPFLSLHYPDTVLAEFDSVRFANPEGAGAMGGRVLLLALSEGRQSEAIELAEKVTRRFPDYDTRLDALCASMLAGDANAVELARELLPTCIAPIDNLDNSYRFFVDDLSFEELESIVEEEPSNGHGYYAAGVKFLAAGDRGRAMQCFEKSAECPNFMSAYPYYSRVILKRMREDPAWPEWLPAKSNVTE
jgi:tetratricopeptide (TPR) repeat protein